MKDIKKLMITLVALFAISTGAWAQATFGVKEIVPPADWENDETYATKGDFPGFDGITIDQAKAWTGAPSSGLAILFYNFDGEDISYAFFLNGAFNSSGSNILQRFNIYNSFANGVKQYYTASAASAVEVAWDKAKKTGTFTMPGGNVTLEPEYFPQATLTAAPTAINDVPATTDGAIVKVGTVANIGSTETAQGTVMYYVSTTALDDAALLALAADQWTADVPTAEKLTKGEAYVYYYVRGNDSDTDEENFSDGDILAANALTVTIAAEPTYAVTFKAANTNTIEAGRATVTVGGTDKTVTEGKLQGVKMGSEVKLKANTGYKFRKVEVKKAAAAPSLNITNPVVGQVIGSDGKNYAADATLPSGVTAVAMIAYVGSETDDTDYTGGLAIALSDEGRMNWSTAKSTCEGKTAVTGAKWCLPSQNQWKAMFKANGGSESSYTGLNTAISTAGGTALQKSCYWSSTEHGEVNAYYVYLFSGNAYFSNASKGIDYLVRAVLAF